jgi:hypothetical protein
MSDLPHISAKSLEAGIRNLKNMDLIEVSMVKVMQWNGAIARGIKITDKGMEYNSSFYAPHAMDFLRSMEEDNKKLLDEKDRSILERDRRILELEEMIKKLNIAENSYIESKNEPKTEQKPITEPKSEPTPQEQKEVETPPVKEQEEMPKEAEPNSKESKPTEQDNFDEHSGRITRTPPSEDDENERWLYIDDIDEFMDIVTKDFGKSSLPICNMVDGWDARSTFYINSYNKLSIVLPDGTFNQIRNPQHVRIFWDWAFKNQHRIGDVIDFSKPLDEKELNRIFKGRKLNVYGINCTVYEIRKLEDMEKFNIILKDDNQDRFLSIFNPKLQKPLAFTSQECVEKVLELTRKG